ncbi:MAG: PHP domain-containing protein, partial [Cyanobacteriota bacterium]
MLRPEAQHHPLTAVLRQVGPESCPGRFNFHCHTTHSDGSLQPGDLASQAVRLGLEHLAITDHHSDRAFEEAQASFQRHAARGEAVPRLWRGVEISALLEGCLVHVLALGFESPAPSLSPYLRGQAVVGSALRAEAVVEAIRSSGGLTGLAHPARSRLPPRRLIAAAAAGGFVGAEAGYDYVQRGRWAPTPLGCGACAAAVGDRG